jgi:hypothetical protein
MHNKSSDKYLYNRDGVYLAKGSAQDVVTSKLKIGSFRLGYHSLLFVNLIAL